MSLEALAAKQDLLIERRIDLASKKAEYQRYVDARHQVESALNEMASGAQVDAVALYSELLSTLVSEVMGEQKQITLETRKLRNKIHLDIFFVENNGHKVDIALGKGGSICNLISVGMRIVSIIQNPYRRFIFLDEPDCWLAPHLIGPFVNVLKNLCSEVGLQAIYISHHSKDVIGEGVHQIHLSKHNGINAEVLEGRNAEICGVLGNETMEKHNGFGVEWLDGAGLRYIEVNQFMSHKKTKIELSPGLNLLTGDNDIGKSAVFRALQAMSINDANASFIQHECDFANVEVGFEDGVSVAWSFSNRKSLPPVYSVKSSSKTVELESPAGDVPSLVRDLFCFGHLEDFDLHFADQKDPLFILNKSIKGHQRSSFLCLNNDFEVVMLMMEEHQRRLSESRAVIKGFANDLSDVNQQLASLKPLPLIQSLYEAVDVESSHYLANKAEKLTAWINFGDCLAKVREQTQVLGELASCIDATRKASFLAHDLSADLSATVCTQQIEALKDLGRRCKPARLYSKDVLTIGHSIDGGKVTMVDGIQKLSVLAGLVKVKPKLSLYADKFSKLLKIASENKLCSACGQVIKSEV
tara:strand:+ start:2253 stop:4004 length:1752 start_codon:yes stop_codon:yes gene_type:complete